jgi:hypothetical protein
MPPQQSDRHLSGGHGAGLFDGNAGLDSVKKPHMTGRLA